MPRPRLTPEERERKRKEASRRSFSDAAYNHYDPSTVGYGGDEDWSSAAEAIFAKLSGESYSAFRTQWQSKPQQKRVDPDLFALGLTDFPATLSELKSAFRASIKKAHPDMGGSNEAVHKVVNAFTKLSKRLGA